jgi:hypothetical protein
VLSPGRPLPGKPLAKKQREGSSSAPAGKLLAACARCHADIYAKWLATPVRNMTRDPERATIRAPLAGETHRLKGDRATMFRVRDDRFVRIVWADASKRLYRVTRIIGNRHREDFGGRPRRGRKTEPAGASQSCARIAPINRRRWGARYRGKAEQVGDQGAARARLTSLLPSTAHRRRAEATRERSSELVAFCWAPSVMSLAERW